MPSYCGSKYGAEYIKTFI